MRHPPKFPFLRRGHRAIAGMGAACLLAPAFDTPTLAQQQPSAMELLGKAQSKTERQAVEDLINKLQGRSGAGQTPPGTVAAPARPSSPTLETGTSANSATPPTKPPADGAPPNVPTATASPTLPTAPPAAVVVPVITPPSVSTIPVAVEPSLPSADIFVYFDFGSVAVDPKAAETLSVLGRALSDSRLSKAIFLIAGHTDAKGRPDYNLDLSQRRADAVRQHLITTYGLAPSKLVALGFGDTRLKDPQQPQSEVNRRVQVVNVTEFAQR